ncbi:hypothetical protein BKA70DRAFT_1266618, partial [Coprinopsis sp. MPI-PUGE-AT-0042]
ECAAYLPLLYLPNLYSLLFNLFVHLQYLFLSNCHPAGNSVSPMHQERLKPKGAHKPGKRSNIRRAGAPNSRTTALIQGSNEVQINDGSFTVVGGDSHTHIHYHGSGSTMDPSLEAVLRAIPNFRKIHQDMLAKATPGTGVWLLKSEKLRVWLEPNGDLKIMWGFGIPGAGKTIIAYVTWHDTCS